jgi:hypothetical protein
MDRPVLRAGDGHGAYYLDLRDAAAFARELKWSQLSSSAVSKPWSWLAHGSIGVIEHAPRNAGPVNADFEVIYGHALKRRQKIKVSALSSVSVRTCEACRNKSAEL